MKDNYNWRGGAYMSVYVLVTACSSILIHDVNQTIAPLLSAFYTFLLCAFFYNITGIVWLKKFFVIKQFIFEIFVLNATTATCWILTFFSLKYIPPDLYLFFYICAMPISATLLSNQKWIRSLLLSVGLCMLYMAYDAKYQWLGVSLAMAGGFSGTIYSLYAVRLTNDFTFYEILSLRFFLTVLIALIGVVYWNEWVPVSSTEWRVFIVLCLVCVIAPITFYQLSIKHLPMQSVMKFIPAAPLLCYSIGVMVSHAPMSVLQVSAMVMLALALLL